jgi:quercetin dioxygenase-like cupin family protein
MKSTAIVFMTSVATAFAQNAGAPPRSTSFDWTALQPTATKVGEVRRVFRGATPTLEELEIHITTLRPGESPHAPHRHPAEELLIVKEGTVESLVAGTTRVLGPGSVIFQASNELHAIKNIGTTLATYHVIQWVSTKTPPAPAAAEGGRPQDPVVPVLRPGP